MPRRYRIESEGDLSPKEVADARQLIKKVLTHPKGWKKYDVRFVDMTDSNDQDPEIIRVHFWSNDRMKTAYPSLDGLSAYDMGVNAIYFNIDNWNKGGVDPFPSDDPILSYRTYVINHEFGHSIGLDHCRPKNRAGLPGSIMMQMTKGLKHIAPCTLNEWPLDPVNDNFDEFKDGKRLPSFFKVPKLSGGAITGFSFTTQSKSGVTSNTNKYFYNSTYIFLLMIIFALMFIITLIRRASFAFTRNGSIDPLPTHHIDYGRRSLLLT